MGVASDSRSHYRICASTSDPNPKSPSHSNGSRIDYVRLGRDRFVLEGQTGVESYSHSSDINFIDIDKFTFIYATVVEFVSIPLELILILCFLVFLLSVYIYVWW